MGEMFRKVMEGVAERLHYQITTFVPPVLVALIILILAFITASALRWLIYKIFKGLTIDKFLRTSGVAFVLDPSGRLRATRVVAESVYWIVLVSGALTGLSVFDTNLTSQIVESFVFRLPKLVVAALILVGGAWLSQYLGRAAVVWAVQEDLPGPRRIAALVRVVLMFVAVVVTADYLDFARSVFLAAFIIIVGGLFLTISLAVGIGVSGNVRRALEERKGKSSEEDTSSIWNRL
jgi:hypothetical protein